MWQDYKASYKAAVRDTAFVAWRNLGAQQEALHNFRVCKRIAVESGLRLATPVMKGLLKTFLQGTVDSRLLSTHATFRCGRLEAPHAGASARRAGAASRAS